MKVIGRYREDKKSFVDSRNGDNFNLCVRTAIAPADRIPYRFDHAMVCLTNVGSIRFTTDTPGVAIRHQRGNILLLPANQPLYTDYIESSRSRPLECLTVELDHALLARVLADFRHDWPDNESNEEFYSVDDVSEFVQGEADSAIRRLHALLCCNEPIRGRNRLINSANEELVVLLLQSHARKGLLTGKVPPRGRRTEHLVSYIREHLREDLSVERLAQTCHLSVSSLHDHFRASFATTPAALVREIRVAHARELLRLYPQREIKWVALESGFNSSLGFSQAFKAEMGMTPSQYRRELATANR